MATCCARDGGSFNTTACENVFDADETVPLTNLGLLYAGTTSTHVTLDQGTAEQCLTLMSAMGCGSDTAAAYAKLFNTCSAALVPTLPQGGTGCLTSFDCEPGTFCGPIAGLDANFVPEVDPTTSSCLPLATSGAPCVDNGYSTDCQYLGLGTSTGQLFCGTSGGGTARSCQPAVANGAACGSGETQQCTSGLCVDVNLAGTFDCEATAPFVNYEDYSVCATY